MKFDLKLCKKIKLFLVKEALEKFFECLPFFTHSLPAPWDQFKYLYSMRVKKEMYICQ